MCRSNQGAGDDAAECDVLGGNEAKAWGVLGAGAGVPDIEGRQGVTTRLRWRFKQDEARKCHRWHGWRYGGGRRYRSRWISNGVVNPTDRKKEKNSVACSIVPKILPSAARAHRHGGSYTSQRDGWASSRRPHLSKTLETMTAAPTSRPPPFMAGRTIGAASRWPTPCRRPSRLVQRGRAWPPWQWERVPDLNSKATPPRQVPFPRRLPAE